MMNKRHFPDDALIGYTGFVGSNLAEDMNFGYLYNSRTIEEIRGRSFNRIICAGVSATKWLANEKPIADYQGIKRLTDMLQSVSAREFILISTIDVYDQPWGVTESSQPDIDSLHPYGRHRRLLELWANEKFENATIVRLPALFGAGLKKNALFDLLNSNMLDKIAPNNSFQWYPIGRLAKDLMAITESNIKLINITTEPIKTQDIVDNFFSGTEIGRPTERPVEYNVWTQHPHVLGGTDTYHMSRKDVIEALRDYLGR